MDTRIRRLASLLVAITLAPVWAAGPAGEGGAVRFNGIAASILKPVVEAVAATGPVLAGEKIATRDGAPGPKTLANGLYMSGRFTYAFFSGSVTVTLDRINNDSLAMTGPLRLDLWATTTRPARAAAFSGYRIASFSTFPSLLPRTHYSDITRSAVIVEPPAGTYWLVLALNEWDATTCLAADYYCLEDSFVSDDLTTFGTPPPGGIVTLAGATSALCMEGVPAEVAAELQRRAPGMYITYPPSTTCSSLGLAFFAGYLSESNNTIRVYTDNAANAATLCATNLLVGCTAGTTSGPFTDLWWNANEPGWGVSISHHASGVAFVAWYTYDAAGKPKWYVVSNCVVSGMGCAGTLHEMTGPPFGPAFDPSQVVARNVGSLAFTFTDLNAGTMRYDVNGQVGTKAISRQPF